MKYEQIETWQSEWWDGLELDPFMPSQGVFDVYQAPPDFDCGIAPWDWAKSYRHVAEVHATDLTDVAAKLTDPVNPWWAGAPDITVLDCAYPTGYWPEDDYELLKHRCLWPGDVVVDLSGEKWSPHCFLGQETGRFVPIPRI